jgi:hypothetical protein
MTRLGGVVACDVQTDRFPTRVFPASTSTTKNERDKDEGGLPPGWIEMTCDHGHKHRYRASELNRFQHVVPKPE